MDSIIFGFIGGFLLILYMCNEIKLKILAKLNPKALLSWMYGRDEWEIHNSRRAITTKYGPIEIGDKYAYCDYLYVDKSLKSLFSYISKTALISLYFVILAGTLAIKLNIVETIGYLVFFISALYGTFRPKEGFIGLMIGIIIIYVIPFI